MKDLEGCWGGMELIDHLENKIDSYLIDKL